MVNISETTYRVFDSESQLLADQMPLDMLLVFISGFLSKYDDDELRIVPVPTGGGVG